MSMDLIIADVTDLPEAAARPGEYARLFGGAVSLDEFAERVRHDRLHGADGLGPALRAAGRRGVRIGAADWKSAPVRPK